VKNVGVSTLGASELPGAAVVVFTVVKSGLWVGTGGAKGFNPVSPPVSVGTSTFSLGPLVSGVVSSLPPLLSPPLPPPNICYLNKNNNAAAPIPTIIIVFLFINC
jgi:hypothetical protein